MSLTVDLELVESISNFTTASAILVAIFCNWGPNSIRKPIFWNVVLCCCQPVSLSSIYLSTLPTHNKTYL